MPFLAPVGAAVGGLIGGKVGTALKAGASIAGGLFAGRKGKEQRQAEQLGLGAQGLATRFGQQLQPAALSLMGRSAQSFDPSTRYWSSIVSGTPATALQAINAGQLMDQHQAALQASRTLYPRGGGSAAATRSMWETQAPAQLWGSLFSLRPTAAQQLASIGQAQGQLGVEAARTAGQMYGYPILGTPSFIRTQQQQAQDAWTRGRDIGYNIWDILQMIGGKGVGGISGPAQLPPATRQGTSPTFPRTNPSQPAQLPPATRRGAGPVFMPGGGY